MDILFIHQNFPGQFKHLAPALVRAGHRVVSLTLRVKEPTLWNGVQMMPYQIRRAPSKGLHPWLVDTETKLLRGEACFLAAKSLRDKGFMPDVIVAHPGWGESLFLRDLWPTARIGLYCEFFYQANDGDIGFDPEFPQKDPTTDALRLRFKNINMYLHEEVGDLGISPTRFQADSFPPSFRDRISVIHDGIDTVLVSPKADARLALPNGQSLGRSDEVITFVNRNFEPYRGYHVFMRALPRLLRERPNAQVVMVGGDDVSYGAKPPSGKTWKQIFIDEVRADIPDSDWARVHWTGKIGYDSFVALLQVSRVHIYLTYPFVLSWSLLEAMSAGAAIVASDTAPLREVITHGQTGLLVDFFDGDALVNQAVRLLDDAELREGIGKSARALAVSRYDLKTACLPAQLEWIGRLAAMEPGRLTR